MRANEYRKYELLSCVNVMQRESCMGAGMLNILTEIKQRFDRFCREQVCVRIELPLKCSKRNLLLQSPPLKTRSPAKPPLHGISLSYLREYLGY
jgi:hypothetical protein